MHRPPEISVVLPVYNAADSIARCVESLAAQDHPSFEVVLVDDGSTDGSAEIARRAWTDGDGLRIVSIPHSGIVAALHAGCRAARGGLIARMDADDTCRFDRLSRQAALLADRPDVAVCSCLVAAPDGEPYQGGYRHYVDWVNGLTEPGSIALARFIESPIPHPSVLIRREALDAVGGYRDAGWAEDYDLWLRLFEAGFRFAKVPEVLVYWRDRSDRLSRVDPRYSPDAFACCKARFLRSGPLAEIDEVVIWGAGRTTRGRARHLVRLGVRALAYVDIDPRKTGQTVGGVPVIPPEGLADLHNAIVLSWVGSRGARDLIRARLLATGRTEGADFILCA